MPSIENSDMPRRNVPRASAIRLLNMLSFLLLTSIGASPSHRMMSPETGRPYQPLRQSVSRKCSGLLKGFCEVYLISDAEGKVSRSMAWDTES